MSPEETGEILIRQGSDAQLQYLNPISKFEAETIDCSIGIWAEENTRAMSGADPARMGLAAAAQASIEAVSRSRCQRVAAMVRHTVSLPGLGAGC